MTNEEYSAAKAKLNELETRSVAARRELDEGLEAARTVNTRNREIINQQRIADRQANELRHALAQHEAAERARAAKEAADKAAAEARVAAEANLLEGETQVAAEKPD